MTLRRLFVVIVILLGSGVSDALTQQDKTIIVLDASGSMWGKINAEPKIAIAKRVVKELADDWDPAIQVGLTAYGHRRKDDCADIEALIPVGAMNKAAFKGAVDGLQAKGRTPLSDAVRRAAEELKFTESRATVVLVSDGIESCDRDPCAVARELEKLGVDFTAHVVGFDIKSDQEIEQLKCIADNTGGRFLNAADYETLRDSLRGAVTEVAQATTGLKLKAVYEPGGAAVEDVQWQVLSVPVGALEKAKIVTYGKGHNPVYKLEPGNYLARVETRNGEAKSEKQVTVVADRVAEEEVLIAKEGVVILKAVHAEGGEALDDVHWEVHTVEADALKKPKVVKFGGGSSPSYRLLPGKYMASVNSRQGEAQTSQEIEVLAGEKREIEVVLAREGVLKLAAVYEQGGEPVQGVRWELYAPAKDALSKPRLVKYGGGAVPEYRLLPGKYVAKVNSLQGKAETQKEVEVLPSELVREEVLFPREGIVELVAVENAGGTPLGNAYWELLAVSSDPLAGPKVVTYGKGATPSYQVLPGQYVAKLTLRGPTKATFTKDVTVTPGQKTRVELVITDEG